MSGGPIKAWRDSWLPPQVSSKNSLRVCYQKLGLPKAYCGRKAKVADADWMKVTCSDCIAASHADGVTPTALNPTGDN